MVRWLSSPITMVVATLGAGILCFSLWGTVQRSQLSTRQVLVLEQETAKMASEVSDLEQAVTAATSEATREKIIRNELLMQKPGEFVVQLPPLPSPQVTITPSPTLSPWQAWQEHLK